MDDNFRHREFHIAFDKVSGFSEEQDRKARETAKRAIDDKDSSYMLVVMKDEKFNFGKGSTYSAVKCGSHLYGLIITGMHLIDKMVSGLDPIAQALILKGFIDLRRKWDGK